MTEKQDEDDDETTREVEPTPDEAKPPAKVVSSKADKSFSPDRFFENMNLLPGLNPGLFESLFKATNIPAMDGIQKILAQTKFVNLPGVDNVFKNLVDVQSVMPPAYLELLGNIRAQNVGILSGLDLTRLANISANTLSAGSFFKNTDEENYAYSPEMMSPASYFERDEVVVESFEALNGEIAKLIRLNPDLPLVWRGQQNHEWGLQSSLYLALQRKNGVQPPSENPKGAQPHPTETQMQEAEAKLISYTRENWRLDEMPALELLARLQHYGAPTRLLDVTRNPYIAAWFAIESSEQTDDVDARLFALATRPVPRKGQEALVAATDTSVRMSELPHTPLPFWHYWLPGQERQEADWGTGSRRRVWIPPAYDQRIVSQNAAFVLDGVPIVSAKTGSYFKRGTTSEYWNKADLLASSSIYAKTFKPGRSPRPNAPNFSPTFTYRITSSAKKEIRDVLEKRFSYNYSTIYPDIAAAGRFLKDHFDDLAG